MLIDDIVILGGSFDVCLPDPQGHLTIAAIYDSVYTLSFKVGVVNNFY